MVTVTLVNGKKINFSADSITRVRKTRLPEVDSPKAKTRLDWVGSKPVYVQEEAEEVADDIHRELAKPNQWAQLTSPFLGPVWFQGPFAAGPIQIPDSWKTDSLRSGFTVYGLTQYVREEDDQVSAVIAAAGGVAVVIDPPTVLDTAEDD